MTTISSSTVEQYNMPSTSMDTSGAIERINLENRLQMMSNEMHTLTEQLQLKDSLLTQAPDLYAAQSTALDQLREELSQTQFHGIRAALSSPILYFRHGGPWCRSVVVQISMYFRHLLLGNHLPTPTAWGCSVRPFAGVRQRTPPPQVVPVAVAGFRVAVPIIISPLW